MTDASGIAAGRLQSLIQRIERLEEEKAVIANDIKAIYQEAKSAGFDTKVMRQVVRLRKMDRQEREEQEQLLEVYMGALGQLADTPLGDAAIDRVKADPAVRKAAKRFVDTVAKNPGDSVSIATASGATHIANVDGKKVVTRTEAPPDDKTISGSLSALKQQLAATG